MNPNARDHPNGGSSSSSRISNKNDRRKRSPFGRTRVHRADMRRAAFSATYAQDVNLKLSMLKIKARDWLSRLPLSPSSALTDTYWRASMGDELRALWSLVTPACTESRLTQLFTPSRAAIDRIDKQFRRIAHVGIRTVLRSLWQTAQSECDPAALTAHLCAMHRGDFSARRLADFIAAVAAYFRLRHAFIELYTLGRMFRTFTAPESADANVVSRRGGCRRRCNLPKATTSRIVTSGGNTHRVLIYAGAAHARRYHEVLTRALEFRCVRHANSHHSPTITEALGAPASGQPPFALDLSHFSLPFWS